ncbi:hypothetical protein AMTRI_Chr01g105070 [Amborella trichopoda]
MRYEDANYGTVQKCSLKMPTSNHLLETCSMWSEHANLRPSYTTKGRCFATQLHHHHLIPSKSASKRRRDAEKWAIWATGKPVAALRCCIQRWQIPSASSTNESLSTAAFLCFVALGGTSLSLSLFVF